MRPYLAVMSARFRMLLQYRSAAVAGFCTQFFWGLIRIMIFEAFFQSTTSPQPMTISQIIGFVWISQALFRILPLGPDPDVRLMVRSGNIGYELLRPIDLHTFWLSRALANTTAPTLLRSIPMLIIAGAFFHLQAPPSWMALLCAIIAFIGAILLSAALSTLISVATLWTISADGLTNLFGAATFLFSGIMIPIPFFPDWAQPLIQLLPFSAIMDAPTRIYLGNIPPAEVHWVLLRQIVWIILLVFIGRISLRSVKRRLVVQGG